VGDFDLNLSWDQGRGSTAKILLNIASCLRFSAPTSGQDSGTTELADLNPPVLSTVVFEPDKLTPSKPGAALS